MSYVVNDEYGHDADKRNILLRFHTRLKYGVSHCRDEEKKRKFGGDSSDCAETFFFLKKR